MTRLASKLPRTPSAPRLSLSLTGGWANFHVLLPPNFCGPVHLPLDCHSVHLTPSLASLWTSRTVPTPEPKPLYFCNVMGFIGDSTGWDPEGEKEQQGFDVLRLETHAGKVVLGRHGDEVGGPKGPAVYVHETWLQEDRDE